MIPPETADRRQRKRQERRDALLDRAADLVEERGVGGLSMAALAEAADYATASLYTYFPSRTALVAALQERALRVLVDVGEVHFAAWQAVSGPAPSSRQRRVDALARLWGFAHLFLTAPEHHPREFRLQQEMLVAPVAEEDGASDAVIILAMTVLDLPRRLLASAAEVRALDPERELRNAAGDPVDGPMARTLTWVTAMNGALLIDRLAVGAPVPGVVLGHEQTLGLLRGWGADPQLLDEAEAVAGRWDAP